jgi:hypothetical protein
MVWNVSSKPLEARHGCWRPCSCELDVLPLPLPTLEGGYGPGRRILFHCSCSKLIQQFSSVGASCSVWWRDWSRWGCGQEWYIQFRPYLAPLTSSIRGWVGPSTRVCVSECILPTRLLCVGLVLPWSVWRTSPFPRPQWFWCQLEGWGGLDF